MCGIAGFLRFASDDLSDHEKLLVNMADTIIHRGPDDSGYWFDKQCGIGLAHRRLSIVDLSPAGHQPMVSPTGRYVIAFNGEIYNHLYLRKSLEKHTSSYFQCSKELVNPVWRGHSDTETLLSAIEVWGLEGTINKCIGMFAIALWDRQTQTLSLVRDRIGEKPLYFGWQGNAFLFGSELKALKAYPSFSAEIDRGALALYMRHNYIPAPYSIYKGISKLNPGCLLEVSLRDQEPKIYTYWSALQAAERGEVSQFNGSAEEAVDELEILLKDSVRQQMLADVPLGAFLSGGVDSTSVVALMQAQSTYPIKTFTIGYYDEAYSEAVHANAVSKYLGTEHTELYVTPSQAMEVIPHLPYLYCEPFADSSQIPTFLVSKLAKQYVKVSLSGDAGDELFCGYNRYQLTENLWKSLSAIPKPLRRLAAQGIASISPQAWNSIVGFLPWTSIGDKLHKGAGVMASSSVDELYKRMVSSWNDPAAIVIGGIEPSTVLSDKLSAISDIAGVKRMMLLDTLTYLPDDILVKVDRAAMGSSLETRVPFLDHRVVEFAWKLPMKYKLHEGKTKWALRQILYRHVPREMIERPKMGFGFPIDKWLRGPLRGWAEDLLSEVRLHREGYFYPAPIREKWLEHLSGSHNWSSQLWSVLMFQAWLESETKQ